MRIGILGAFYDCESTLREALNPWRQYKETQRHTDSHQVFVTAINCQFKEYADLGHIHDDTMTQAILNEYSDVIDSLLIETEPKTENEVRTKALLDLMKHNVDLIWILDGDEVYTRENIEAISKFVTDYPAPDVYKLNLKNCIFDRSHWLDMEFTPPRLFWAQRHNGLIGFEYDNSPLYRSGADIQTVSTTIIPKQIAYVTHLTWQNVNGKKKVAYQQQHFGYSMFRWNESQQTLEYDPAYFAYWGGEPPIIYTE